MRIPDLEAAIPGLRECRETEHYHRAAAFAGLTWTIAGCEIVALTPRHRLELQLARNAFTCGAPAARGDVFQILWRLNPYFHRRPSLLHTPRAWLARRRVQRAVARCDLGDTQRQILTYIVAMFQDMPERAVNTPRGEAPAMTGNYIHWAGSDAAAFLTRFTGFSVDAYLDTPLLVLQQLMRAWRLANSTTDDPPTFLNESDRLVCRWQEDVTRAARARSGTGPN